MTNELEKQFFSTFGIEPKYEDACTVEDKYWDNEELANEYGTFDQNMNCKCDDQENCTTECSCAYQREVYPQITSDILLELIFILTTLLDTTVYEDVFVTIAKNREELKKDIFQECMLYKQHIKHKVRRLFEEDTNDR